MAYIYFSVAVKLVQAVIISMRERFKCYNPNFRVSGITYDLMYMMMNRPQKLGQCPLVETAKLRRSYYFRHPLVQFSLLPATVSNKRCALDGFLSKKL